MKTGSLNGLGLVLVLCALGGSGCRSADDASWERLGVHKRDLLKKKAMASRDVQKESGERFTDALAGLKELYGADGAQLEKAYGALRREYGRAAGKAEAVRTRIT